MMKMILSYFLVFARCSLFQNLKMNNKVSTRCPAQTRSLLFVKTPTELVSPLVSPTVRFSFENFDWQPQKSALKKKKPSIQPVSTPSKQKRVRFNTVASQIFYPVNHFYPDGGYLISPDNKITRRGLLLILVISLCCVASGLLAYSTGRVVDQKRSSIALESTLFSGRLFPL